MGLTRTSLSGSIWNSSRIQKTQLEAPCTPDSLLSSRKVAQRIGSQVMAFREIENLMPIKDPPNKIRMLQTLLRVQAISYFEHHLRKRIVLRDVGLEYIPKHAKNVQRYYMRQSRDI
jgi:hypothetical protein